MQGNSHCVESLLAAAENHRITGFETDGGGIDGHIGTGFINNADDTDIQTLFVLGRIFRLPFSERKVRNGCFNR